MLIEESSEKNDKNNWVKKRLLNDDKHLISFEGYTIHSKKGTALFDRRMYTDTSLENYSNQQIEELIRTAEPYLEIKLYFAKLLKVNYYYVFYNYDSNKILLYRFGGEVHFSISNDGSFIPDKPRFLEKKKYIYDGFCRFMQLTVLIRDLHMTSGYMEKDLPRIDEILRSKDCGIPWMGNLDGIFLSNNNHLPVALVEFQTTNHGVAKHCNNKYFLPFQGRGGKNKGDEQRWRVLYNISVQTQLPLIIIVWSPKEVNASIKYKVVSNIIFSDDMQNRNPGLYYEEKELIGYEEMFSKLERFTV